LDGLGFVAQWVLVGVAVWVVISMPLAEHQASVPNLAEGAEVDVPSSGPGATVSADQLKGIWERRLRQTLIEPKPKPKPKPKPPPPPRPVDLPGLLATFVERGQAWGLFVNKSGEQKVRSTLGRIDDFDIVRISPGRAELGSNGRTYEVRTVRREDGRHR
jgi:hypothetical protein